MAIKTKVELGEQAWLRLTQSQQLDLFKELIIERIQLGELLGVANKSLDHLRTDVDGAMNQNAELVHLIEEQRGSIAQQKQVIDGQGVELDRMQRMLGLDVGH